VGRITIIHGKPVVAGSIRGQALTANTPLSFWGGFNPDNGEIIDQRHPLAGHLGTGRILVIPSGRGSCSGSGVLLEAIRQGTAPAAIITSRIDPIIGLGCILGDEIYGSHPVMIVISEDDRQQIKTGDLIAIEENGTVTVTRLLADDSSLESFSPVPPHAHSGR
jgi:hypothetical protein